MKRPSVRRSNKQPSFAGTEPLPIFRQALRGIGVGLGPENQFLRYPEQEFLNRKVRPAGRTKKNGAEKSAPLVRIEMDKSDQADFAVSDADFLLAGSSADLFR
jgi:hypothetical protein